MPVNICFLVESVIFIFIFFGISILFSLTKDRAAFMVREQELYRTSDDTKRAQIYHCSFVPVQVYFCACNDSVKKDCQTI